MATDTAEQRRVPMEGMPDGWWTLDGVRWHEAPIPPRWHRCRPQQQGWLIGRCCQRCACGAMRTRRYEPPRWHDSWFDKNSRRRADKEARTA